MGIHQKVLDCIKEDGVKLGVAYYRRHQDFYDNLSARDTMLYHRGILDKLERKLGARPTSMLTNDDPFFGTDPWTRTEEECEGILKHRQSQWKTHISSAITFYEHVADTLEHRDDIPIIPPRDPTGYS